MIYLNVDGFPISKDFCRFHAYSILLKLCTNPSIIICDTVYLSEMAEFNKMPEVNEFLDSFITEIKRILNERVVIGDHIIKLYINAIVCDAPARSDMKKYGNHNSYSSCERCVQKRFICRWSCCAL